ncbi:MAG: sugar phosphate isomerase/epimerase [Planctomycetota bacterium]|jgi:sugar phosphate isomerase/epimerase|nr:sugar phosphate isomerase/epimerase [Planctomycetota bacterium]MDP7636889.1 sugar phosphate isomerase/epimerase [Phycisphaerae bacterium]
MLKSVLAAQLYTVRDFTQTLPEITKTLRKVADIGYHAVQISGFGPVDPKEVAKVVMDRGLVVCATHVHWDRFLTDLDAVIDEHLLWRCPHAAIGSLPEDYYDVNGLTRFLDEFFPVAETLAKAGMDFSYHNHSHELVRCGSKTWLEMLYEQADPKHLKAEIDTYWIQHGGSDPAEWIRKCAGREPLLHLKDMAVTGAREQRFSEVGEGNLNWPPILKAAAEGGVEWYIIEQDLCYGRDPFESLALSLRNLKEMGLK